MIFMTSMYASVEGAGEMSGWLYYACSENTRAIPDHFMAEKNVFAIELKENGKVTGPLGFHSSRSEDKKNMRTSRR